MFKRTLALVLALCMMFDSSSITALAAESQTEVVSEVETEETEEVSEEAVTEEETATEEEAVTEEETATEEEAVTEKETATEEEVVTEEETATEEETIIEEITMVLSDAEYPELVVNTPTTVTIPAYSSSSYLYYTFTVPENGYYNFHADKLESSYAYMNLSESENYLGSSYMGTYADVNLVPEYLEQGAVVYVGFYTYSSTDVTATVTVEKVTEYALVKQEDGSYATETDEFTFTANMEAGYATLRGDVALKAKEGVTLADYYYVEVNTENSNSTLSYQISYYGDYFNKVSLNVNQGTEYGVYYTLRDYNTNEPICVFAGDIVLTTGSTDKSYVIYETIANETSIVFDAEFLKYIKCYYAPTDGSETERTWGMNQGWEEYKISSLQPDTEYYFEFIDDNDNSLGKEIVRTAATTAEFTYEAAYNEDGYLVLNANMSNYQGEASYAYFYYKYVDIFGNEQLNYRYSYLEENENGTKSFSDEIKISPVVLGDSTYDIELWVQLDNAKYGKTVKQVTAPKAEYAAEDITFTVTESETAGYAEYTVSIAGLENSVYGELYYKPQAERQYNSISCYIYTTGCTSTISVQAGVPYDFVLYVGGVKKEVTATIGKTTTYLTEVGEVETHPFDFVRTFKVESAEELTGTYYLRMYYFDERYGQYQSVGSAMTLNADNAWQVAYKTADGGNLIPGTEYEVKWTLSTSSYGTPVYTLYETIKTSELEFDMEVASSKCNTQSYAIGLKEDDIVNLTNTIYLNSYVRKQGEERYQSMGSVSLYSSNAYKGTLNFNNLKAETTYEVSLRDDSGNEYTTWTFTTPADTRTITITGETTYFHSAELQYSLSNMDVVEYSYILAYVREEGTDDTWYLANSRSYSEGYSTTGTMWIYYYAQDKELEEDTTYEYKIGFGTDYSTPVSALSNVCEGTFTTLDDTRTVSANASAGYTTANLSIVFSGNNQQVGTDIYMFYKPQDSTTWISLGYNYAWNTTASFSNTITGLTSGSTYDYAVVIPNYYNCNSPDEVTDEERKATGTFTTKENTYDLEFKLNESKLTYEKAVVTVTAKGGTDSLVNVLLTLSDANGVVSQKTVDLKSGTNYTKDITFEDLLGSTEYTISSAEFSVKENGNTVSIGTKPYEFKFTTKEAVAPTSITLNKSEIVLNAACSIAGYNREKLIAAVQPATAADDLYWTTSNPNVASVTSEGVVVANGIGTATITATSRYSDKDGNYASVSCEVVVKKYVVGRTVEGILQTYDNVERLSISKNGTNNFVSGLGLYEVNAEGNATPITDCKVTTAKDGIVAWDNGTVRAIGVGETYVVFEKDGIKAAINVETFLESVGFSITGFETNASAFPAVKNEDGSYTLLWLNEITYLAIGMTSPVQEFNAADFNWTISDPSIATVDEYGVISPKGYGTTTLTVAPKSTNTSRAYVQAEETITLVVHDLPYSGFETVYAITNVANKLSDVGFPYGENISKDWNWKYPTTPLVTNGINRDAYYFEAVYNGTDCYPLESSVQVYIGKINGVSIYETGASHRQVLLTSTEDTVKDSINLVVGAVYEGTVRSSDYVVEIPAVKNLTITKDEASGYWTITALKAGNYTLKPVIKVGDKVVAKGTYNITAVDTQQVASIALQSNTTGVTIDASNNKIIFDTVDAKKDFELKAVVKDRTGTEIDTKLKWNTSDKSVVTVAADKKDSHIAKVTAKGEGHAVITVVADDKVKYQVTLDVEIQNHAPRVSTNKATVNTAYDYNDYYGKNMAATAGQVEIVPVYNSYINSVQLYDKTGTEISTDLKIQQYSGYNWLVMPIDADLKNGTYDCTMRVTTSEGVTQDYPLKVSVTNKKPSVKANMSNNVNLFFTNATGDIQLTGLNGAYVSDIMWEDADAGANNGFSISSSANYGSYFRLLVSQQADINVVKGKLQDANVAKGTLTVKLQGYRDTFTFKNFSIKTSYKKPNVACTVASTNVAPDMGQTQNSFYIYDKTSYNWLSYNEANVSDMWCFNEFTYDNEDVALSAEYYGFSYTYTGTKSTKITINMDSVTWREPLSVKHSINVKNPKIVIYNGSITFNTAENNENMAYAYIYENSFGDINFADIAIKGTNAKAEQLVKDDLIVITADEEQGEISIKQNDAATMGKADIAAGTYQYKVTPYYISESTGEKKALNTVTLSVKIVTKPVTVKVSPSGSIDLSNGTNRYVYKKINAIWVDPKFSNTATGDHISSYRITGEYSKYFSIGYSYGHYYISTNSSYLGKLRAGQSYKLAVEYTMQTATGETYTVTSNTFTVKPKQSTPKVTVAYNNQTLYAAADNVSRSYYISLPDSYYRINSAYGSLDCNKDGIADIVVNLSNNYGYYGYLNVSITDCDGVISSASGKSYTIPVTVQVQGRDGISKDATVSIKVTVKR